MWLRSVIGAACLWVSGCGTVEDGQTMMTGQSALVGTWSSNGDNLAAGFKGAPFNFASIDATFNPDSSYTIKATDSTGKAIDFAGTWSSTTSLEKGIFNIEQQQSMPQAVVSRGIYSVDANTMTFEIIQVQPDVKASPASPSAGFGSTTVQGTATAAWIQKYVRK